MHFEIPPPESKFTVLDGKVVHFYDCMAASIVDDGNRLAPAKPVIVLIHGFMGAGCEALPLMAALGNEARIIAPDCPGAGFDDRSAAITGMESYADFVPRWIDHVVRVIAPGTRSLILAGHSMGGHLCLWALYRYRYGRRDLVEHPFGEAMSRVDKLVLLAPDGLKGEEGPLIACARPWVFRCVSALLSYTLYKISAAIRVFADISRIEDSLLKTMFRGVMFGDRMKSLGMIAAHVLAHRPVDRILHKIRLPVLLIWGRLDKVLRYPWSLTFRKKLPVVTFCGMAGCGHMPHMEYADLVADRIRIFASFRA